MNQQHQQAEAYKWQVQQDDKTREVVNESYVQAQMENIKGQRGLVLHFITISAGIIGLAIPVFNRTDLVRERVLLIGGLLCLLLVVTYGFYYLVWILQKENKNLVEQNDFYNRLLSKQRDARNKFFIEKNKENYQAWLKAQKEIIDALKSRKSKEKVKLDYALDIIFACFISGLTLMTLSLIDFSNIIFGLVKQCL